MSGEGPTSAEEEVVRLRAELARSQEKLQTWKQKTEAGVNQLRQQVIDLTGALTQSRAEIEAVKRAGSVSSSSPQGSGPDAATTTSSSSSVDLTTRYSTYLGLLHSIHSAWWAQKAQIVADASRSISSSDVRGEYESYKRRMVATLKLQAQNTDALQRQVAEKTEELSHLQAEIVKRDKQHSNMVEALNAAEQRVSANHETIQTLRREVAATNGRLNMEEEHAVHDSYEERLQAVLEEQQAREEAIFSQHEDEMQRLRAQHHKEMGVVRTDCERRVAEALEEAARRVGSSSVCKEEVRDESYAQLLSDYEVVKQELEDARAEVAGLKLRVRDSDGRSVDRSEPAQSSTAESRSVGRRSGTEEPRTLKDAVSLIADLRLDLEDAVNQLWECKRELLAVKRGASRETSATTSATALNDSSFAYLRAIMVKFLCSIDDVRVVVNLLPVLSTLLRLQDDEIKQIYSAHPKWISS